MRRMVFLTVPEAREERFIGRVGEILYPSVQPASGESGESGPGQSLRSFLSDIVDHLLSNNDKEETIILEIRDENGF